MSLDPSEIILVNGTPVEALCDAFYALQPKWVQGSLSRSDARFLFKTVFATKANRIVEIGTAAGFSTALLCYALKVACEAGLIDPAFQVVTYDVSTMWYADPTRRIGDAARAQLPPPLLEHVLFRNPAMAADVRRDFGPGQIPLLFIDANHKHPWPTLDLFATLDSLAPGATVVLHDINLPVRHPQFADWGAKFLFDDLALEKTSPNDESIPNIGSFMVPPDRDALRVRLIAISQMHQWQANIPQSQLDKIGFLRLQP
jgi:predicted O-methyltransferase YrrM